MRLFILSDSPPEKDVQWSEEGIISSSKFIQKLWTLHLKITEQIYKGHQYDSSTNLVKFTNKFLKKISDNLNSFSYNVIIANLHEMYSFLIKEINNEYTPKTMTESYKKILVSITPIIPHFSSECLKLLGEEKNLKWPEYNQALLEEEFIDIVIQINGKKRGLIKVKKNIESEELVEKVKNEKNIMKYLNGTSIKKKIYVTNRLINIIV